MKCLLVLIAAFLVCSTSAAPSKLNAAPACSATPPTWSGYIYEITFEDAKLALRVSQANYDRTQKKIKITDINVKETAKMTTSLLDYSKGASYVSVGGQCTKGNLTGDIPGFGVPSGASTDPTGPKYIGASLPNLGVFVYEYYGTDSDIGNYYMSYAPIGDGAACVPILRSLASLSPLKEGVYEYTNITTSLPSGDPFSMPPGC